MRSTTFSPSNRTNPALMVFPSEFVQLMIGGSTFFAATGASFGASLSKLAPSVIHSVIFLMSLVESCSSGGMWFLPSLTMISRKWLSAGLPGRICATSLSAMSSLKVSRSSNTKPAFFFPVFTLWHS